MTRPKSQEAQSFKSALSLGARSLSVLSLVAVLLLTGCSGDREGTKSPSGKSNSASDRSLTSSAPSTTATAGSTDSSTSATSSDDSNFAGDGSETTGGANGKGAEAVNPSKPSGKNPLLTGGNPQKYKMLPRTKGEEQAAEILKGLEALVKAGKKDEALDQAQKAAKLAPDYPPVWNAVGVLLMEIDKHSSLAALKRATALDPYYYMAWGNLGVYYEHERRPSEAMQVFKHLTEIAPNSAEAWVSLGEMYLERNNGVDAEIALKHAIELDEKDAGAWYLLGLLSHGSKRGDRTVNLAEAVKCYKRAIALDAKLVPAQFYLAVLYRSQHKLKESEKLLRRLTQIAPDYQLGWTNLASVLAEQGDKEGAKKVLAQSRALNPNKAETAMEQCSVCLHKRDFPGARKYALEARRKEVKWYRPWYFLAKIAVEEQKFDEAIQFLEGSIKCDKNQSEPYNLMGCTLAFQGKMPQACKAFQRAYDLEPDNAMYMANLSEIMRETEGDQRKARLLAKRAEQLAPKDPHVVANAAMFLLVDGLIDPAIEKLNYVTKLDPNYTTAWNYLGVCYGTKKDAKRAIECFKKSVKADPNNNQAWKNLAELYRAVGDKSGEAEALKNSLKANVGTTAEGLYSVAYKLEKLGQKSSASAALKQGLDMDPAEADVLLNVPYVEDQHKDEAIFSAPPDLLRKRGRSD